MRLVRSFNKKNQESNEEARRRFFRRIFGILWETFNFNLIFLSDLMKKYHSFQFSGYILMTADSTVHCIKGSSNNRLDLLVINTASVLTQTT